MCIQESWQVEVPTLLYSHLRRVEWEGDRGHLKKEQFVVVSPEALRPPPLITLINIVSALELTCSMGNRRAVSAPSPHLGAPQRIQQCFLPQNLCPARGNLSTCKRLCTVRANTQKHTI